HAEVKDSAKELNRAARTTKAQASTVERLNSSFARSPASPQRPPARYARRLAEITTFALPQQHQRKFQPKKRRHHQSGPP
ncbi:MAG: hypothetical protein Q7J74_07175, partial [Pseudomonas sp.]|nr:hypothetical protein [Pseudomonas sp.]